MPKREGQLFVEGLDDKHVIGHLLLRHGITSIEPPSTYPKLEQQQGLPQLLATMKTAIRAGAEKPVGFVLDADENPVNRWQAVRTVLEEADVTAPETVPPEGFTGASGRYLTQVGVWLMPDNKAPGSLEHFLEFLIAKEDSMWAHARESTVAAVSLGAAFSERDTLKAEICAWLAWQEEPGLRFGTALKAKYFNHDSVAAMAFVKWFRRLFSV